MSQGFFDETKATARLPNLDIEIVRSLSPAGDAERLTISLQAAPSVAAFGRFLEATNPFLFWMRFAQTAWTPWLGTAAARLPIAKAKDKQFGVFSLEAVPGHDAREKPPASPPRRMRPWGLSALETRTIFVQISGGASAAACARRSCCDAS
jgi:hypothetical protein